MNSTYIFTLLAGVALVLAAVVGAAAGEDGAVQPALANPLFAFDNGTGRDAHVPLEEQAHMLKDLGYAGIGYSGAQRIPEMLKALDRGGLKMFSVYMGASVDPRQPPYEPGLKTAIKQLEGRETLIWLFVTGGEASSTDADDRAVAVIRDIAEMAQESGLRVALYPHVGFYVARVEDAVRLAKKAARRNVGASFNLSHFLKLDDEKNLHRRLNEAMPYLLVVSINGADSGQTNEMGWSRLIQTLDRGSFDVAQVLRILKRSGYEGPIGLQCYGIPGDPRENLARSMAAWRKLAAGVASQQQEKR